MHRNVADWTPWLNYRTPSRPGLRDDDTESFFLTVPTRLSSLTISPGLKLKVLSDNQGLPDMLGEAIKLQTLVLDKKKRFS